jgi:hypothetical protein
MRRPKIVPAKVWRLPQAPPARVRSRGSVDGSGNVIASTSNALNYLKDALPDLPGTRPAPEYFSVMRSVELAMRSLPLLIEDYPIETLGEKYADLLYSQIGAAAPMTAQQARAHLAEIHKCAWALAQALKRAGPDIAAQLEAFRATSLDRCGIKTPSVGAVKIAVQWIAEAAAGGAQTSKARAKRKGPQRKDFVQAVSRFAAEDYYRLTGVKPTATKRIHGDGFLEFLRKIFKAMESPNANGSQSEADGFAGASAERFAADAVKWLKSRATV